ncbi:TonB-dependent receptor plug domain-containing protein [Paraferrimonas haliotis]|uniref:TonB-dependent receptor n=1 Tax=Paraferrimonas haliotis TaxID=2013866 RepID=A0AA37X064_9GAMM|nr:TonB-dependent receptor [Paraferrimonas haliotis]GLS84561.1 TonB-dependent receptor [Paraferrimonas haliotis]
MATFHFKFSLISAGVCAALSMLPMSVVEASEHEHEHAKESAIEREHDEHQHEGHDDDHHDDEHGHHDEDHGHDHHGHHDHHNESIEKIQVRANRLGRVVNDAATRIEIINGEEIQEKALMRPGNISMLVAETGGVRVQTTSPALGSANIRLQSLYGRYTQLLSDGLPLYGGQASSIGLLQIPPTDLANVEIIKGSASSMYGGSALGGVINLISRQPGDEFEGEILANATSKDGQDVTGYFASPLTEQFSGSVTAGLHRQTAQDLDNDGWIDLAGYERATVRPRMYWSNDDGANLYVTLGAMTESRKGGTLDGFTVPDGTEFKQNADTKRSDLGFAFDQSLTNDMTLSFRGSAMLQDDEHQYGSLLEVDSHKSYLIESSVSGYQDHIDWVAGIAYQSEVFDSETFSEFDYTYQVPGLFAQVDYELDYDLSASVSARADWHNEYGSQISPRVSMLYHPDNWSIRGSYGLGFFAPTPFVEEIDAAGLSRLEPLQDLKAEKATTASLDGTYTLNSIETGLTLFATNIDGATELETIAGVPSDADKQVRLVNSPGETRIRGAEVLIRYRWHDVKVTGSYLYTDSSKPELASNERVQLALTPKHSAGAVIMWEQHGKGLLGFEAYYTGSQRLEDNPYLNEGKPYWHLGLLGQITFGRVSLFVNAENLLDIRQTKEHPLVLPARAPSGTWTTDIWSRNDGFIVNAGVRVQFGV